MSGRIFQPGDRVRVIHGRRRDIGQIGTVIAVHNRMFPLDVVLDVDRERGKRRRIVCDHSDLETAP